MPTLTEAHIASKRRIGTLEGKPVVELMTSGGLYLVVTNKSDGMEVCGSGPHRAVARFLAKKKEPNIVITELSKSDWLDETAILSVADKYERLTEQFNSALQNVE